MPRRGFSPHRTLRAIAADGITAGNSGFEAIPLTKAYARFGMVIRNNNQGTPKYAFVRVATRCDT